jgi:protein-L-isoaspartate(D-aspartate) O-methyltransferase
MTSGNGGGHNGDERRGMLREIEAEVAATADWTGRRRLDSRILDALLQVPRHEFVAPDASDLAYRNDALPIGHGQTISQPFIVALMTDLLALQATDRVLEIGTGSGYQAAILSRLVAHVWSVEVIASLAASARERLTRLGYDNVSVLEGDGAAGWPEQAPFDAIIVTAQSKSIPPALITQLAPGGRLVLPLGGSGRQMLTVVSLRPDGQTEQKPVLPVTFVPLV